MQPFTAWQVASSAHASHIAVDALEYYRPLPARVVRMRDPRGVFQGRSLDPQSGVREASEDSFQLAQRCERVGLQFRHALNLRVAGFGGRRTCPEGSKRVPCCAGRKRYLRNPDQVFLQLCGLTDGHVPNLTVGAVQRNYQSMLQRLHSFALLTQRDPAVPAC